MPSSRRMNRGRRTRAAIDGEAAARHLVAVMGRELRATRKRRGMTQMELGRAVGLSAVRIGELERGDGAGAPLEAWMSIGIVLGRPVQFEFGSDRLGETADAGHLAIQELVLRLGLAAGFRARFELPVNSATSRSAVDVGLRDDRRRLLVLVEAVNTVGDLGSAVRTSQHKAARVEDVAVAIGQDRPYAVRSCWVVRATQRNRALLARYPEVFRSAFPASSDQWVRALTIGSGPPDQPGLVWCDVAATRLFAWRPARPTSR